MLLCPQGAQTVKHKREKEEATVWLIYSVMNIAAEEMTAQTQQVINGASDSQVTVKLKQITNQRACNNLQTNSIPYWIWHNSKQLPNTISFPHLLCGLVGKEHVTDDSRLRDASYSGCVLDLIFDQVCQHISGADGVHGDVLLCYFQGEGLKGGKLVKGDNRIESKETHRKARGARVGARCEVVRE